MINYCLLVVSFVLHSEVIAWGQSGEAGIKLWGSEGGWNQTWGMISGAGTNILAIYL